MAPVEAVFQGDKVLVAVGRKPCTTGLGLEEAGVAVAERTGFVKVDDRYATNLSGVYAIGDLIGGPMLALGTLTRFSGVDGSPSTATHRRSKRLAPSTAFFRAI